MKIMKRIIRIGMFESNSSSAHTISIAGKDKQFVLDYIYPDDQGIIYVHGGEFGWEWAKFNDAETKLEYAYQSNVNTSILERIIKEKTGATSVIFDGIDKGYIDHQSNGTVNDLSEKELTNFIFNKNSWLFTGNDNGEPSPSFYEVPEFRDGKIYRPKFKYELTIDNYEKTEKFLERPTDDILSCAFSSMLSGVLLDNNGTFVDDYDIMFQLMRKNDYYEYSYKVKQDFSNGYILFLKENSYIIIDDAIQKKHVNYRDMPYDKRQKLIDEELLKHKGLFKKVYFQINHISGNPNI